MLKGHRLRIGRYSKAGLCYVVTTRTARSRSIFENLYVGRIVVRALMDDLQDRTETPAFVVMPDHVHWLFRLLDDASLSGVVRRFKGLSARRVNDKLSRQGSVWQRGYFDHCVRGDRALVKHARYIVGNPLRTGLVTRIEDYPLWDACWL